MHSNQYVFDYGNDTQTPKHQSVEMDAQYDEMITTAWAFSIATPSDVLTAFIVFLNKLIDDTNTAYNQRMAQSGKSSGKERRKRKGMIHLNIL